MCLNKDFQIDQKGVKMIILAVIAGIGLLFLLVKRGIMDYYSRAITQ